MKQVLPVSLSGCFGNDSSQILKIANMDSLDLDQGIYIERSRSTNIAYIIMVLTSDLFVTLTSHDNCCIFRLQSANYKAGFVQV